MGKIMAKYEDFDPDNCLIVMGDASIPLKETLIVENSDIQTLGASVFTGFIANLPSKESDEATSWISSLIEQLAISGGSDALVLMTTSQVKRYISFLLGNISDKSEIPKVTDLTVQLSQQGLVDPYKIVPESISRLDDPSTEVREANLGVISRLEALGEPVSEFVRSSYEWNLRSVYLERERWVSLSTLSSTLMYVLSISLIASLSVSALGFQNLLASMIHLVAFCAVSFFFAVCMQRASKAEGKLSIRLKIPTKFLHERKELRKQVLDHYIRLLEWKHEKWRTILNSLLRLFMSVTVPSLIAILLRTLPVEATSYFLGVFTVGILSLSLASYIRMHKIEDDLVKGQKALRQYYG